MNRAEAEKLIEQTEIRVEHMGIGGGRRVFIGTINDLLVLIELAAKQGRKECTKLCDAAADDLSLDHSWRTASRVLANEMKNLRDSFGTQAIPDDEPIRRA